MRVPPLEGAAAHPSTEERSQPPAADMQHTTSKSTPRCRRRSAQLRCGAAVTASERHSCRETLPRGHPANRQPPTWRGRRSQRPYLHWRCPPRPLGRGVPHRTTSTLRPSSGTVGRTPPCGRAVPPRKGSPGARIGSRGRATAPSTRPVDRTAHQAPPGSLRHGGPVDHAAQAVVARIRAHPGAILGEALRRHQREQRSASRGESEQRRILAGHPHAHRSILAGRHVAPLQRPEARRRPPAPVPPSHDV